MRPSRPAQGSLSAMSPSLPQRPVLSSLGWRLSPDGAGGSCSRVWVSETPAWSLGNDQLRPSSGWKDENDQRDILLAWVDLQKFTEEATGTRAPREPPLPRKGRGLPDNSTLTREPGLDSPCLQCPPSSTARHRHGRVSWNWVPQAAPLSEPPPYLLFLPKARLGCSPIQGDP